MYLFSYYSVYLCAYIKLTVNHSNMVSVLLVYFNMMTVVNLYKYGISLLGGILKFFNRKTVCARVQITNQITEETHTLFAYIPAEEMGLRYGGVNKCK